MTDFRPHARFQRRRLDHGWGSHHFVLGGAVQGGKIYGMNHNVSQAYIDSLTATSKVWVSPIYLRRSAACWHSAGSLQQLAHGAGRQVQRLNHALDRGELLATTSGDAVMATIAKWFGVPLTTNAEIDAMFPTVRAAHPMVSTWGFWFDDEGARLWVKKKARTRALFSRSVYRMRDLTSALTPHRCTSFRGGAWSRDRPSSGRHSGCRDAQHRWSAQRRR